MEDLEPGAQAAEGVSLTSFLGLKVVVEDLALIQSGQS